MVSGICQIPNWFNPFLNRVREVLNEQVAKTELEAKSVERLNTELHEVTTGTKAIATASLASIAEAFVTQPDAEKLGAVWHKSREANSDLGQFWANLNKPFPSHGTQGGRGYTSVSPEHEQAFISFYDMIGANDLLTSLHPLASRGNEWWADSNKLFQWGFYAAKSKTAQELLAGLEALTQTPNSKASYFMAGLFAGLYQREDTVLKPSNKEIAELSETHPASFAWAIESILNYDFAKNGQIDKQNFLELINKFDLYKASDFLNHMMGVKDYTNRLSAPATAIKDLVLDLATKSEDLDQRAKFLFFVANNYCDSNSAKKVLEAMLRYDKGEELWTKTEGVNKTFEILDQERNIANYTGFTSLAKRFGIAYRTQDTTGVPNELLLAAELPKIEGVKETAVAKVLESISPTEAISVLKDGKAQLKALKWFDKLFSVDV